MRTTYLKNTFLIASWIMIATSFGILAANPQPTSIQASLVNLVQYLGELHITSDGTPHGDDVLSINSNGNFVQTRSQDDIQYGLVNDWSVFGMPYVWAMASSWDYSYFAGIEKIPWQWPWQWLISVLWSMNLASWRVNYIGAKPEGIAMSHVSQVGVSDADNSIFVNESGVQFSFIGASNKYRFPTTAWQANQVLTTDGAGQLSWENAASTDTKTTTVYLSSSDILSLDTTPIILIPAPAANQINIITELIMIYRFGTTPYYIGDNMMDMRYLRISYGIAPDFAYYELWLNSVIAAPEDAIKVSNDTTVYASWLGQNIQMSTSGNGAENGDGTLELRISYKTIDM